jgi:FdhE protein
VTPGRPLAAETLGREHPEWRPWLAALDATARAASDPAWAAGIPGETRVDPPGASGSDGETPRVHGAVLEIDARRVRRFVRDLFAAAASPAAPGLAQAARSPRLDPVALLGAAVRATPDAIATQAATLGVSAETLAALGPLVSRPLLQACARAWPAISPGWRRGYCPVCGAWPTLAEVRGLEGERRLRCGRCGADWWADWLRCPYCDNREHTRLGALVPSGAAETCRIETCEACGGYIKTHTTLSGADAAALALLDLATVELDLAALARGFRRPEGPGYRVQVAIAPRSRLDRLLAWGR